MILRRRAKELYNKIKDRFKGRINKKTDYYWPELKQYCGCCPLSTGIYIRSIIILILSLISMGINSTILNYLLSLKDIVQTANLTEIDEYLATHRDDPEDDLATLYLIYRTLVIYYMVWIGFKALYVIIIVWTVIAIYKKKPSMVKLLLYICIPNLIVDIFISLLGIILLREDLRLVLVICYLSEGYNILAINSEYIQMRGKSRLAVNFEAQLRTEQYDNNNLNSLQIQYHNTNNQAHCSSCSCYNENNGNVADNLQFRSEPISSEPLVNGALVTTTTNPLSNTNENVSRLNNPINRIEEVNEEVGRTNSDSVPVRPNSIDLSFKIGKKDDVSDAPVIYDEQQLNVGLSPVIEDRTYLDTTTNNTV